MIGSQYPIIPTQRELTTFQLSKFSFCLPGNISFLVAQQLR
jgi:hypothetical protein